MFKIPVLFRKKDDEQKQEYFSVERKITIDMGHRVYTHGSKCHHLHGHTYTIYAKASSPALIQSGTQKDMVIDFSFLKESMMEVIDKCCDHGLVLSVHDPLAPVFCSGSMNFNKVKEIVKTYGYYFQQGENNGRQKLYLIESVPTAERLAKHWYDRLQSVVLKKSGGNAKVTRVRVWETPNCFADYPG